MHANNQICIELYHKQSTHDKIIIKKTMEKHFSRQKKIKKEWNAVETKSYE